MKVLHAVPLLSNTKIICSLCTSNISKFCVPSLSIVGIYQRRLLRVMIVFDSACFTHLSGCAQIIYTHWKLTPLSIKILYCFLISNCLFLLNLCSISPFQVNEASFLKSSCKQLSKCFVSNKLNPKQE